MQEKSSVLVDYFVKYLKLIFRPAISIAQTAHKDMVKIRLYLLLLLVLLHVCNK
jgi:hypothetical protein